MSASKSSSLRGRPLPALVAILVLLCPLGYALGTALLSGARDDALPFLTLPDDPDMECIRDIEYMRFRHMDLLTEMRDAGVRGGASREATFTDCTRCHTSREQFCDHCHDRVNLVPDCFDCHYYP